ncbi:DUF456 family protein [Flavobacterium luteum]|uniref:DUF456 family protein n=1 Tax=Flavobacterium luteum TaxID=2026654 RepID=UPI002938ED84|nr:DUF456 family protein [Flavobacterium luteum]
MGLRALVGELIYESKDHQRAFKAAIGFFIVFLASSFMKFVLCTMYLGLFIWIFWTYKTAFF